MTNEKLARMEMDYNILDKSSSARARSFVGQTVVLIALHQCDEEVWKSALILFLIFIFLNTADHDHWG